MEIYSSISYTNRQFGFFAPTVNDDFTLSLRVFKNTSDTVGDQFYLTGSNSEKRIRLSTMLWHFAEGNNNVQMDLYARSWGVYCMNNNKAINKVIISIYKNYIPTMSEYEKGRKPNQTLYYQTTIEAE
jgi:hypothetical protein